MTERFNAPRDSALYELISAEVEEKLRRAADLYTRRYPHVSTIPAEGLRYVPEENSLWTCSFFPGMMYLAYDRTGDNAFLAHADAYLDSFEQRIDNRIGISHDLGFLYTLSSVALYKLTGNQREGPLHPGLGRVWRGRALR